MTPEGVLVIAREAITALLLMAIPIVGVGLLTGLTVAVFQATTQIQEPTLVFVPKIIAIMLAIMFFSDWIMNVIVEFTTGLWGGDMGQL